MTPIQAIYERRAVRDYKNLAVPHAKITELIHAAVQAPSAVNQQPWAFAIFQGKDRLKSFSDRAKPFFAKQCAADTPDELRRTLTDLAFNIFYNANTLIVICARPTGMNPAEDCCLAAQNLMLAAHAMGLATCVHRACVAVHADRASRAEPGAQPRRRARHRGRHIQENRHSVRATVAMTGEITLRGLVLPIGGLKEKSLAAMRAGIRHIIIPKLNEKDLPDIPPEVKKKLKFTLADNVDEVLAAALAEKPARTDAHRHPPKQRPGPERPVVRTRTGSKTRYANQR